MAVRPSQEAARAIEGYNHGSAEPVRALRKRAGLSLRQLQELTGINRAVWSQIETGRLLPQAQHMTALSRALDVPADEWEIRFVLERKEVAE